MAKFYLFSIITFITCTYCNAGETITVTETEKQFIGNKVTVEGKEIDVFLGIPYAEPPIGKLRFKRPIAAKYSGPVNATQWSSACYQPLEDIQNEYYMNNNVSEDCLYLNVWTPANRTQLKAVMFWIHGGALIGGSASFDIYNPQMLAERGDVVVVTINYRLQAFGFMYTGSDDAPGNVGLWDQVLALQWVWDNIQHFGGDRDQITIFGESAGSWSVSLHLVSPVSRHLFKNAIMMSGAALQHLTGEHPEVAKNNWLKVANFSGCGDGKNFTRDVIECIQTVSPDKLNAAANRRELVTDSSSYMALVRYGDEFLPLKAIEMLKSGDYKKNVNLLAGNVDDEGSIFLVTRIDPIRYTLRNPFNFTKSDAYNEIKKYSSGIKSDLAVNGDDAARLYISRLPNNDYDLIRRTIGVALGDFYLTCPTIEFAKLLYLGDKQHSKVYQYYFTGKLNSMIDWCAQWQGSCHGTDTVPTFGYPLRYPNLFNKDERALSEKMVNTFTHFAKYGYPSAQEGVEWPAFYMLNDNVIKHYYEFANHINMNGNFGTALKEDECEKLWKPYVERQ